MIANNDENTIDFIGKLLKRAQQKHHIQSNFNRFDEKLDALWKIP